MRITGQHPSVRGPFRSAPSWISALLLCLAGLLARTAIGGEDPSKPPSVTPPASPPPQVAPPPASPRAGGQPPQPGGGIRETEDPDKVRDLLAAWLGDQENRAGRAAGSGLKLSVLVARDALGHRVAREYVRLRIEGGDHAAAVRGTAALFPSWKRREGMAAAWIRLENTSPGGRGAAGPAGTRQLYTFQGPFPGDALALLGPDGKRLPAQLAEPPKNLRLAQLRVKKFYLLSGGTSVRRGARPEPGAPAAGSRKPRITGPTPTLVLEDKPLEAELLFRAKTAKDLPRALRLSGFLRYEGPFQDDTLDLNEGGRWDPIEPLDVELSPPAAGQEPPSCLERLVREVREKAQEAKKTSKGAKGKAQGS